RHGPGWPWWSTDPRPARVGPPWASTTMSPRAAATSACSPSTTWPRASPTWPRGPGRDGDLADGGRRTAGAVGLGPRPHRRHHGTVLGARDAHGRGGGHRVRDLDGARAR